MGVGGVLTIGVGSFTSVSKMLTSGLYAGAKLLPFEVVAAGQLAPVIVASHFAQIGGDKVPTIVASYITDIGGSFSPTFVTR